MVLRGRFTRLHHIPDHERWDSVICMQTWYEAAIYAYSFPGFSPTRHRSWRREPWKRGCSCEVSRDFKQLTTTTTTTTSKNNWFYEQNESFARAWGFQYISLTSNARLRREISQCDVLWRTWTYDDKFSFLYLNVDKAINNSSPGKVAYIWRIERFQIDAIKFKRTQIHFFSDVFTAVVVVVA